MKKHIAISLMLVLNASAQAGIGQKLKDLDYFVSTGMLAKAMAKEICTCVFVGKIGPEECMERNHIPSLASGFQQVQVNERAGTVTVVPDDSIRVQGVGLSNILVDAKSARARYHDDAFHRGCTLE